MLKLKKGTAMAMKKVYARIPQRKTGNRISLDPSTIQALTGKVFTEDYQFAEVWGTTVKVRINSDLVYYIKINI